MGPSDRFRSVAFTFGCILVALMVGFRSDVGGDWTNYLYAFRAIGFRDLGEVLASRDPAYLLLNWVVRSLEWPFWVVTLFGGVIFARGLYSFSRTQPEPWLAALIGIPYLTIVVAMGYNRQGIALGLLLLGLAGLVEGRPYARFLAFTFIAALFHSSAVIAIPLTVVGVIRSRLAQFAVAPAFLWYLYSFLLRDYIEVFVRTYVNSAIQSEGAAIRLALCIVPALLFLLFRRRLAFVPEEEPVWRNFSLAAIALVIIYVLIPSSTAIDRVALYILPLQLAVFSRLPLLLGNIITGRIFIILLSLAIQFVWLTYAKHASDWIPYKMTIPFT